MNRREALQRVAMILGGSIVGANLFLEGCTRSATKTVEGLFDEKMINIIGDLADAILPPTSTPGAKEAGVGSFIPVYVRDCYTEKQQKAIVDGLATLDKTSKEVKGKDFASLTIDERTEIADKLYKEAEEYNGKRWERIKDEVEKNRTAQNELVKSDVDYEPEHWFYMFRQMTLTGFFNSELGLTKALRYVKIPGKYDGDYPYKKGDKAFY
ncbi:gluconate 2-dehydrogenase subunit 3 family protein [Sphingobacterium bovistauri]|uniref:Gluconate 2-dehydrogenase subunit 3 family protein n=1 Tax=Sphingobacterium bovistauri TaxID=2781959 RepID=A0ABS7Z5C6_9SPHI|nr:gluconate 2-dehydrogenase subunit 3 family protein [Sphingobacterium bovistauri]MCA5004601.1 gluconate 2-dehydrogenase subunit 3 family protein [Sphingobacterium bovistauri]